MSHTITIGQCDDEGILTHDNRIQHTKLSLQTYFRTPFCLKMNYHRIHYISQIHITTACSHN